MPITRFDLSWSFCVIERGDSEIKAWRKFLRGCKKQYINIKRGLLITPHKMDVDYIRENLPLGSRCNIVKITDKQIEDTERVRGEKITEGVKHG